MNPPLASTSPVKATSLSGSYRWAVILMLWLVCFANYADRQAIYSVFPPLQHEFALTRMQLGMIGGAFMWTYAIVGPFAGWLCDRVSRRRTIIFALLFWSACTIGAAFARNYEDLLLCRILSGLGEAFYFPAALSLIADYHGKTRSRAMSLHQTAVYVGTIAGAGLAGWLAEHHGWRDPFVLFGAFGFILTVVLLVALREPQRGSADADMPLEPEPAGNAIGGFLALLTNPAALVLIATFIGANFVGVIFLTWTPEFLYEKFHMSLAAAGFHGSVWLQLSSICTVILAGVWADRLAKHHRGGRVLVQAAGLLLGAPFLFLTGWAGSVSGVLLAIIGFGFAKGIYDSNTWAALYDVIPTRQRATATGFMNSLGWFGGGLSTIAVAAASSRYGFGPCLSATSVIYGVLGILLLVLGRHRVLLGRNPKSQ